MVNRSGRLGISLTIKASRYLDRKPQVPGQRHPSDYKKQLVEIQKFIGRYNISEAQMRQYYQKATSLAGYKIDALIRQLETRLDALVNLGGFARPIYQACQFVSHGLFLLRGKSLGIPLVQ